MAAGSRTTGGPLWMLQRCGTSLTPVVSWKRITAAVILVVMVAAVVTMSPPIVLPIAMLVLAGLSFIFPRQARAFYASLYGMDSQSTQVRVLVAASAIFGAVIALGMLVAILSS